MKSWWWIAAGIAAYFYYIKKKTYMLPGASRPLTRQEYEAEMAARSIDDPGF